ncbi:unnamed protein product [Ectocarpus sp. 12 AP-2014]
MTGYVQKDEGRSWYKFDSVGLTQDFCRVALANYRRKAAGVLKDNAKIQINKKSFWPVMINLSQKEYFPLKMSGAQLALYAIQSGEYGPCYSWISSTSSQGIPVEKAVSFWRCWTAHAEVQKQDIYHVFFDTRPTCGCQEWDLADAAYDDMTASQAQSFASRQRDLLSALTDTERVNLSRQTDRLPVGNLHEAVREGLILRNIGRERDSSDEEGSVAESDDAL